MPRPRAAMRKIREVLRLVVGEGRSRRQVGRIVGLPPTTVHDYVLRAERAGIGWPLPDDMDDAALEARLFTRPAQPAAVVRPLPDWPEVHRDLRKKGVTLQLLHLEYKERHPDGYQYTQFVELYRRWEQRVDVVMRQPHKAGEKCFVDWEGQTLPIVDPNSGAISEAQLFIAVMGASSFTFADIFPSQELPHWISGHVNAIEYFGACPELWVCDNLKPPAVALWRFRRSAIAASSRFSRPDSIHNHRRSRSRRCSCGVTRTCVAPPITADEEETACSPRRPWTSFVH